MTTITWHELGCVNNDGVYSVAGGAPFAARLKLQAAWPLPTTESFYLMIATNGGGTIAVTDVT